MSKVERFEDLDFWQDSRKLVGTVYSEFKYLKDFGFKDQIQRATLSVMNNIAEGFERSSDNEFRRFLYIAKGSSGEVRSMLYVAEDLEYLNSDLSQKLRKDFVSLSNRISGFIRYLDKCKKK